MGILDLLGDLSSKRSKELGLGGLRSLLGTRGAAQAGAVGDEMIGITNQDSLPGYFNEQTREYVPWYVDLFDGGGLNAAGGQAEQAAAAPNGAPMAQSGLLANNQLSDMEMANRNRASQMTPSLGSQLSDMEMANRNRVAQIAPSLGSQLSDMEMANRSRVGVDPRNLGGAEGYGSMGQMPTSASAARPLTQPFAGGNETPRLSEMQTPMMQHPAFPKFVELMKQQGHGSSLQDPRFLQTVFNHYLRLEGL